MVQTLAEFPPAERNVKTTETGMQVIKKVLNSSVILVEDERGVERVLLGKGLGYGAKPGQHAPSSATDRVFIALEDSDQRSLVELLAQIPVEFVDLTRSVVADAADAGLELDPHIYLALTTTCISPWSANAGDWPSRTGSPGK